jgi:SAM-dependent methyltransferase
LAAASVEDIVRQIHRRAQVESAGGFATIDALRSELAGLASACEKLSQIRHLVGRMPPRPNTLRARMGEQLILVVKRLLFWYTPQINRVHEAAAFASERVCRIAECQLPILEEHTRRLDHLRKDLLALRTEILSTSSYLLPPRADRDAAAPEPPDPDLLMFHNLLQDHFRGDEASVIQRQQIYVEYLASHRQRIPAGPWIDLGCGRGEWLASVSRLTDEGMGVDQHPISIERCRTKGLHVEQADALQYLRNLRSRSTAVVTAFHMLEHMSFDRMFLLVKEVSRVLRPDGLFLIETPNPENLHMGACQFWQDPTHDRPIPAPLMERVFEHCGMKIARRFFVNPKPEEQRFPFRELGFIRDADQLLNGPQDYGLVGSIPSTPIQ